MANMVHAAAADGTSNGRPVAAAGKAKRRHQAVSFTSVKLRDPLWVQRQKTVRTRTIPFLYGKMEENGLIEALDVESPPGPLRIPFGNRPNTAVMYWDSDIAKWIETASYALATERDPELEAQVDELISRIAAAQRPDGYFNTYFIRREPAKRWTNLRDWHELYCAGHLIEAAVAHVQATGKTALIDVMRRYADYIATVFGTGPGQKRGYCGHPEIELALVKLYRQTGESRYLDLARYFVEERGRQPHYFDQEAWARGEDPAKMFQRTYEYSQSHVPVREQTKVVGHAVRAMYLYSAIADLAGEFSDESLSDTGKRLWADLMSKRLYVTGGLGPNASNEGFTFDYDLPNETAYAETCASVGLIFWAHRMLLSERDGRYADAMELALYNNALSGLALDGEHFFYDNPLASRGEHHRWTWHRCPCCPANIGRLVASIGEYVCSTGDGELAVHLYTDSRAETAVNGVAVTVDQKTRYPWDGGIDITLSPATATHFALRLRIPAWCRKATLSVNGEDVNPIAEAGYVSIERTWKIGDRVRLSLEMPAERIYANPEVRADAGRIALQRGPIVYCVEAVDNAAPVHRMVVPRTAQIEAQFEDGLLGGVATLAMEGAFVADAPEGELYRTEPLPLNSTRIRAVPYHVWDHRKPGEMAVWLREG